MMQLYGNMAYHLGKHSSAAITSGLEGTGLFSRASYSKIHQHKGTCLAFKGMSPIHLLVPGVGYLAANECVSGPPSTVVISHVLSHMHLF